jgi:hypothetical protein
MPDYESLADELRLVATDLVNEHYCNGPGVRSIIEDLERIAAELEGS